MQCLCAIEEWKIFFQAGEMKIEAVGELASSIAKEFLNATKRSDL